MVEAGVEPDPGRSTNWLMAHDFRRKTLILRRFSPSIESPRVPYCPQESTPVVEIFWRRRASAVGGVDPVHAIATRGRKEHVVVERSPTVLTETSFAGTRHA